MHDQALLFLKMLFSNCTTGYLTLSAIHPDGQHTTPSRHIALNDDSGLSVALRDLLNANAQGWGAFFGVATRQTDLGRWRRGGQSDVSELPALFVDLDVPVAEAMRRLRVHDPPPSCMVGSGRGVHAYWFLDHPTSDWRRAAQALQHLRQRLGSDKSSTSQALRLVGSRNTKQQRNNAPCQLLDLQTTRYPLTQFVVSHPKSVPQTASAQPMQRIGSHRSLSPPLHELSPRLIAAIEERLMRGYGGFRQRNGWLAALCPCGHDHDRPGMHFAFNSEKGIGMCLGRHGRLLLKDLCAVLGLDPVDYGGVYLT